MAVTLVALVSITVKSSHTHCNMSSLIRASARNGQVAEVFIWTVTAFYAELIRREGWLYNFTQWQRGKICLTRWVWYNEIRFLIQTHCVNFSNNLRTALVLLAAKCDDAASFVGATFFLPFHSNIIPRGLFQTEVIMFGRLADKLKTWRKEDFEGGLTTLLVLS